MQLVTWIQEGGADWWDKSGEHTVLWAPWGLACWQG